MKNINKVFCLFLMTYVGFSTVVWACEPSLYEQSLEEKIRDGFASSPIVFSGEFLRFENVQGEDISKTLKNNESEESYIVFKVNKIWKGSPTEIIKFKNGSSPACEYTFIPAFHLITENKMSTVFLQKRLGQEEYYPIDVYKTEEALPVLHKIAN